MLRNAVESIITHNPYIDSRKLECMGKIDKLLEILACPKCKGDVVKKGMFIVCENCKLAYPILENEIPDMLIEDAWPLEKAEKNKFKHNLKI